MTETFESSVLPRLPMTKKLVELIGGISEDHPVGLGAGPRKQQGTGAAKKWVELPAPYFILYPGWTTVVEGGGWNAPDAVVEWFYQVRTVSERVDQIEWMRDRVIGLFLARDRGAFRTPIPLEGMDVIGRRISDDTGIPPDPTGSVFQSDIRFAFKVAPRG